MWWPAVVAGAATAGVDEVFVRYAARLAAAGPVAFALSIDVIVGCTSGAALSNVWYAQATFLASTAEAPYVIVHGRASAAANVAVTEQPEMVTVAEAIERLAV